MSVFKKSSMLLKSETNLKQTRGSSGFVKILTTFNKLETNLVLRIKPRQTYGLLEVWCEAQGLSGFVSLRLGHLLYLSTFNFLLKVFLIDKEDKEFIFFSLRIEKKNNNETDGIWTRNLRRDRAAL